MKPTAEEPSAALFDLPVKPAGSRTRRFAAFVGASVAAWAVVKLTPPDFGYWFVSLIIFATFFGAWPYKKGLHILLILLPVGVLGVVLLTLL